MKRLFCFLPVVTNINFQQNLKTYNKEKFAKNMDKYLLPKDVKPISYDLYLFPNLATETFIGRVLVEVELSTDRKDIILHNHGLKINTVKIDGTIGEYTLDEKYQLLQINLPNSETIKTGKRKVTVEFSGDLKNRLVGFYSSRYTTADGAKT